MGLQSDGTDGIDGADGADGIDGIDGSAVHCLAMAKRRSGGVMRQGPRPRLEAPEELRPVDLATERKVYVEQEVTAAMLVAEGCAREWFGLELEPYVGLEWAAHVLPPWARVCVDVEGLPTLTIDPAVQRKQQGARNFDLPHFDIWRLCAECGWPVCISLLTQRDLWEVLEAPCTRCPICKTSGRTTGINWVSGESKLLPR